MRHWFCSSPFAEHFSGPWWNLDKQSALQAGWPGPTIIPPLHMFPQRQVSSGALPTGKGTFCLHISMPVGGDLRFQIINLKSTAGVRLQQVNSALLPPGAFRFSSGYQGRPHKVIAGSHGSHPLSWSLRSRRIRHIFSHLRQKYIFTWR